MGSARGNQSSEAQKERIFAEDGGYRLREFCFAEEINYLFL
jgi:hypothetical protein